MSLIMEAIKRAQELRLQKGRNTPFFQAPGPWSKKKLRAKKYFWMASILALGLALLFLAPGKDPLPGKMQSQKTKVAFVVEESSSSPSAGKDLSPEVPNKGKNIFPALKEPGAVGQRSAKEKLELTEEPKVEKVEKVEFSETKEAPAIVVLPESPPAHEDKGVTPPVQATSAEISSPPATTPPEPSRKSFALEKEGDKSQSAQVADVLAYFNRGVHFSGTREVTQALQSYQKVIELDPAHVEAYNNLGILYQELGDLRRAQETYQKALEINPRYEKAQNNLGTLFYLAHRYEESIAALQKALVINPRYIESYCNLGALYKKIGQPEKAVECYQKALAINPLHGETHYNLGLLYEHAERMEPAVNHYRKFMQLCSKTHPDLVAKVRRNLEHFRRTSSSPLPSSSSP